MHRFVACMTWRRRREGYVHAAYTEKSSPPPARILGISAGYVHESLGNALRGHSMGEAQAGRLGYLWVNLQPQGNACMRWSHMQHSRHTVCSLAALHLGGVNEAFPIHVLAKAAQECAYRVLHACNARLTCSRLCGWLSASRVRIHPRCFYGHIRHVKSMRFAMPVGQESGILVPMSVAHTFRLDLGTLLSHALAAGQPPSLQFSVL